MSREVKAHMKLFIFDGDCAFCSSAMRLLRRMAKNRTPSKPYQHVNLQEMNLTLDQVQSAVQYIRDHERFSGARAIAEYLIDSKTIWSIAGRVMKLPVLLSFTEIIYEVVASNRQRLPGGTPECQIPRK